MTAAEELAFHTYAGRRIAGALHVPTSGANRIVVMAHGFKSSKIGPSRYFVPLARELARRNIATFRFDQAGSGDSEGDFDDSSFKDWIGSIKHFAEVFLGDASRVALLGQSMGGLATLAAADRLEASISGIALWSPGVLLEFHEPPAGEEWMEEEGQRVRWDFWREAARTRPLEIIGRLRIPAYVVFGTNDAFISHEEIAAFTAAAGESTVVSVIDGLPHSEWPRECRTQVLAATADFLEDALSSAH